MTTPYSGWGKPALGAGVLRYPQIMSPNFNLANPSASPSNSWALLQSGLAYLFGVVLSGGTITGPDYIINTSGIFIYSGTPANGNLIGSWAGSAGTDAFGNAYPQGFNVTVGTISGATVTASTIVGALVEIFSTMGGLFVYGGTGAALNANPNFLTGITDWTYVTSGSGAQSYSGAVTYNGHDVLLLSNPGQQGQAGATNESDCGFVAVTAGSTYTAQFALQVPSSFAQGYIKWYNSSSVQIGTSAAAETTALNTWQVVSVAGAAPAGATKAKLAVAGGLVGMAGALEGVTVYCGQAELISSPLVASIAPASGTDSFGNAYKAGITAYGTGSSYIQFIGGTSANIAASTGDANESNPSLVATSIAGSGGGRQLNISVSSPSFNGNGQALILNSRSEDGTTQFSSFLLGQDAATTDASLYGGPDLNVGATGPNVLSFNGYLALTQQGGTIGTPTSGMVLFANATGTAWQSKSTTAFSGDLPAVQTDNSQNTVTQAANTRLTKAWSIPANDAQAQTLYRITAYGTGTQGSTQQTLSLFLTAFGISGTAGSGFPTTFAGVSTAFGWELVAWVAVSATGNGSATVYYHWQATIKAAGASADSVLSGNATATTATTTSIETLQVEAKWGSTTGAPTITCNGSMLERLGP